MERVEPQVGLCVCVFVCVGTQLAAAAARVVRVRVYLSFDSRVTAVVSVSWYP